MPVLLPSCHQRIVARFSCEGKPDNAWKSRIFNNLACTRLAGPAFICGICRAEPIIAELHGEPGVIVVLVERGGAMIATRPDKGIFAPHGRIQTQTGPALSRRDSHDQRQRGASRGGPSSPVERAGAVYQGPVVRKSERPSLAGAATTATGDQYPDQCQRQ